MRYGRPTYSMKDQLLKEVKSIRKLKTWDGFFQVCLFLNFVLIILFIY